MNARRDEPAGPSPELRERILEALRHLLDERTFDSLSVAEIIAAAGVSRASFYFYFPGKQAALAELVRRAVGAGHQAAEPWLASPGPSAVQPGAPSAVVPSAPFETPSVAVPPSAQPSPPLAAQRSRPGSQPAVPSAESPSTRPAAAQARDETRDGVPDQAQADAPDEAPNATRDGVPHPTRGGAQDGSPGGAPNATRDGVPHPTRGGAQDGVRDQAMSPRDALRHGIAAGADLWLANAGVLRAIVESWGADPQLRELWLSQMATFTEATLARIADDPRLEGVDRPALAASLTWLGERLYYLAASGVPPFDDREVLVDTLTHVWTSALSERA
ncbi:TetR family transcriptional regulator [Dactylosporangium sp. CS-033363]|uniref:TetR/AcrR family transcriptional regulator n=1 Tax=Dactylosporangium sp. CS-033363 TaxID=3239935 RepID=UPI003D8D1BB7